MEQKMEATIAYWNYMIQSFFCLQLLFPTRKRLGKQSICRSNVGIGQGLGFRVRGFGFRGFAFKVQGVGFRVQGFRV